MQGGGNSLVAMCWLACVGCSSDAQPLEVDTESGPVRGLLQGESRMWRGIPYAAPPVGPLRWKSPQPPVDWDGVHEAFELGPGCAQVFSAFGSASTDEDCLYLNIWAPTDRRDVPVLVWFHGGAFVYGSGGEEYYAGQLLAETQHVVVVTVNYRLGVLGFLAHPALATEDPSYPTSGNWGLEDQRMALGWVQRNIAAFGGDPKRVTIFGESAGGMSTCLHYVSSKTTDLFHSAISESGLCADNWLVPTRAVAEGWGVRIADVAGCSGTDAAAASCLRSKTPMQLLTAATPAKIADQPAGGPFYLADEPTTLPNVDGIVVEKGPREAFATGGFAPRPLVLGSNRDEGTLFHIELTAKAVTTETDFRAALERRFGAQQVDAIMTRYPMDRFASYDLRLAEITGDSFFVCPTRRAARGAAAAGAPVYLYSFEREIENPIYANLGVFHASEIPFVFGGDAFPFGKVGAGAEVATTMQTMWADFARDDVPLELWPKYDASDPLLVIDAPNQIRNQHKAPLCDFWDGL